MWHTNETGMTVAYNIDCMEAMSRMKDNEFDLAIVDPPYGTGNIIKSWQSNIYTDNWNEKIPRQEYFNELIRVSINQIIWGCNYFGRHISHPARIVWNKLGTSIGNRKMPESSSECELASYSVGVLVKMFSYTYIGNVQGNDYQILWGKQARIHPTQKPVALYKWLLKNYAKEGDRILDTHLGSGSSRIAAHDMGFDFTGYEIDKDYFDAQEQRFANHIQQGNLFKPNEMY